MGKTAFSGPVFGAKQTLYSAAFAASTGSSFVLGGTVVPSGEDWYATELALYRGSTGSSGFTVELLDDSSLVTSVNATIPGSSGGSTIAFGNIVVVTADAGEYEGTKILSGSVISFRHSSHAGPNVGCGITLSGYRRWIPSSRVE